MRSTSPGAAWAKRAQELAGHFWRRWVNRADCFGRYYAKHGKYHQATAKDPLTQELLIRHCKARETADVLGIHTTVFEPVDGHPDGGKCLARWPCVDIDHHGPGEPSGATERAAMAWHDVAAGLGLEPLLLDSNGNGGFKLYILFAEPILTARARRLARWLTRDWQDHGLAAQPECFPKQDKIGPPGSGQGSFGNWVRLPGRHYKRDHWTRVWDGSDWATGDAAIDLILQHAGISPLLLPAEMGDYGKTALLDEVAHVAAASEGHRHDETRDSSLKLMSLAKGGELNECEAQAGMHAAARGNGLAAEDRLDEVDELLRSAREMATPRVRAAPRDAAADKTVGPEGRNGREDLDAKLAEFHRTDTGNGERMAARFGARIRYCHPWAKWLHFDGRRWKIDDDASVRRLAKQTVRDILGEAKSIEDATARKKHAAWAFESESNSRLNAMLHAAAAELGIPILPAGMDRDPWALNVLNGTIDLRTGELRPHRREDELTALAPVQFNPEAKCSTWITFLDRIFDRNAELIQFVKRLAGIALTGDVSEQILPICYGSGANGKTTLLTALLEILGEDYAMMAPPGLLMMRRGEAHPTERAALHRKRLVVDMESAEGARLNEAWVKQLTGSDKITARRMREDFWSFDPTHKIIMGTNHRPEIRETKNAIWRRVKLVSFDVVIPEPEQRADLPKRLRREYPGILAWAVRGCLDWQRDGLKPPQAVVDATAEYRAEQDQLAGFLADDCIQNATVRSRCKQLYEGYRMRLQQLGVEPMSLTAFGLAMKERGFEKKESGGMWYLGIALRQHHAAKQTDNEE
jgi:P4 family phage/plasmid primase-like protien